MWPWGHAAVGYLTFIVLLAVRRRRGPTKLEIVAVLFGTQFPDLVDKTFAWIVPLLPSGRSLGHSLLTWATVLMVAAALRSRADRLTNDATLLSGFAIGYLLAIVTDLPTAVLVGDFSQATFLFWPITPAPTYGTEPSLVEQFQSIRFSGRFWVQAVGMVILGGHLSWTVYRVDEK